MLPNRRLVALLGLLILTGCAKETWDVPAPVVTGPVTGPGTLFCASSLALDDYGYVEEEYFLEGEARRYDILPEPENALVVDSQIRYKTRMIVR